MRGDPSIENKGSANADKKAKNEMDLVIYMSATTEL